MLEKLTKMFSNLRTDKGRNRYPAVTRHRAPHKTFLLLSVMDLIAQGQITTNFIAPSFDLLDTFNGYWSSVMPAGARTSMAYPFSRLRTDRFWHRIPKPGYDSDIEYNVSSMERLQEMYFGAKMDDELLAWSESRDDRPTNGLALCRLCHWSFDEGLMSVGASYEVLVSRRVRTDQNMPDHMLTLADRPIFRPAKEPLWPAQDNLGDHRRRVFKN